MLIEKSYLVLTLSKHIKFAYYLLLPFISFFLIAIYVYILLACNFELHNMDAFRQEQSNQSDFHSTQTPQIV
jgi:hypothetical protein